MRVRALAVASAELAETMVWYSQRSPRAAETFWLKIQEARRSIVLFPQAAPLAGRRVRRFLLPGYPYDLIYSVLADEIVILAVAHHSRRPGYWMTRLQQLN